MSPEFKQPMGFDMHPNDQKRLEKVLDNAPNFHGDTREQLELVAEANEILFQDIRDEAAKLKKVIAKSPTITEAAQNPLEHLDDESFSKEDYEKNSIAMKQEFEALDVQAREKLEKILDIRKEIDSLDSKIS